MAWRTEQVRWRTLFGDLPMIHENDPVGNFLGELHLVCHDDHRHAIIGEGEKGGLVLPRS